MANYDSAFTGVQIDAALTNANSATQPGDLGTAATTAATDYATAAQGALANSATQPGDLGTAATTDATDYATAAQGALANSATQPGDIALLVESDVTGVTGADAVSNIMSLTQAEYDAITPDASTIYVITDA